MHAHEMVGGWVWGARTGSEVPLLSFAARFLPCSVVNVSWSSLPRRWGLQPVAHLDDIGPQDEPWLCCVCHSTLGTSLAAWWYARGSGIGAVFSVVCGFETMGERKPAGEGRSRHVTIHRCVSASTEPTSWGRGSQDCLSLRAADWQETGRGLDAGNVEYGLQGWFWVSGWKTQDTWADCGGPRS